MSLDVTVLVSWESVRGIDAQRCGVPGVPCDRDLSANRSVPRRLVRDLEGDGELAAAGSPPLFPRLASEPVFQLRPGILGNAVPPTVFLTP